MKDYSTFKVIKIIDEYSLVINGGLNDDISLGDKIEIYLEGEEIKDPFNEDKILGTLDYIKETLEITEVYLSFAVCKKLVTEKIYHPSAMERAFTPALSSLSGKTETKTTVAKIEVDEEQMTGRKTGESTIRIGDLVRVTLSE